MADEIRERQLERVKEQEALVRKLKTIKLDDIKVQLIIFPLLK